jgi:hypothetical protein
MTTVRTRSIPRRSFTPEPLRSLHALADRMLSEDIAHLRLHAETNEVVHVYERTDTGAPVGFQFWRTAAMDLRDSRGDRGQAADRAGVPPPGAAPAFRSSLSLHAGEPGQARVDDRPQAMT